VAIVSATARRPTARPSVHCGWRGTARASAVAIHSARVGTADAPTVTLEFEITRIHAMNARPPLSPA